MMEFDPIEIKEYELDIIDYFSSELIDQGFFNYAKAEPRIEFLRNRFHAMALSVRWKFIGKKEDHVFHEPVNWWEHLKQDQFPDWLLKKFPVKTKEIRITETAIIKGVNFPEHPRYGTIRIVESKIT
jgi:hypothetical protein